VAHWRARRGAPWPCLLLLAAPFSLPPDPGPANGVRDDNAVPLPGAPNGEGDGGGSFSPAVAVGPNGECVVMKLLALKTGAASALVRVVPNAQPVVVNGHRGLIGIGAVHGFYDVQPGGVGGPFQKIAGLHKVDGALSS
jgi:hypothetical protein